MDRFAVYIMVSRSRVIYIGITGNLEVRIAQHKQKYYPKSFTAKYNVFHLVYFELFDDPLDAIAREKQLKGWSRKKKIRLIEKHNPTWRDISLDWA